MLRRVGAILLALLLGYLLLTATQVAIDARSRAPVEADAIVVLGAAQYNGRPSPALQARLDRAASLYHDGLAPQVWVTGGQRPGDRFSEASASDLYLQRQGVPRSALRLETQGANTYDSLAAAARYLKREGTQRVLLISDPWHSHRLLATAEEVGLDAAVSPGPRNWSWAAVKRISRETLAVAVGRVIGYRRLKSLQDRLAPVTP